MLVNGNELTPFCPVFVSHDDADFRITAGTGGLEVLVMQYPGGQRVLERKCLPLSRGQVARGLDKHAG